MEVAAIAAFWAARGIRNGILRHHSLDVYKRQILTKIVGCGFGAKMCKFTNHESIQIGAGMVSRGEVALIVATKGAALGLMSSVFFGPVIIMVVATTIVAPILLKLAFRNDRGGDTPVPPEDQLKTCLLYTSRCV